MPMKILIPTFFVSSVLVLSVTASGERPKSAASVVDIKTPDGTILKATYFAAAKPGPGVLLFHQSNRTRKSWDDVAARLAAAGINTLTLDMRGFGESGGTPYDSQTDKAAAAQDHKKWHADLEVSWQYPASQQGVTRDVNGP